MFNPKNLDAGLAAAAEAFTDTEVEVDEPGARVTLSKIFGWYRFDFGKARKGSYDPVCLDSLHSLARTRLIESQDQAIQLKKIIGYMREGSAQRAALERLVESGKTITVIYKKYDWSTNAK